MRFITLILALAMSGCTTIDYDRKPPEDWPKLKEVVHVGEPFDSRCKATWISCAVTDFQNAVCHVFLPHLSDWMLKHERAHCDGYDHHGESIFREAWEKWKQKTQ